MEHQNTYAHDTLDAIVAKIFGWFEKDSKARPAELRDIAFSDEWERKQIARELHWN
jgi:hypothetical protein